MASDSAKIGLGVIAGFALAVAVLVLIRMHQQERQAAQAQFTSHNVVRDDQGRIQTVETLSGLPMGSQQRSVGPTQRAEPREEQQREQHQVPMRN